MYVEFKQGQKFAGNVADMSEDHTSFADAGWVLTDDDLVVDIDCLDKDVIKKLIAIFNIGTQIVWTDRGVHLYFKKPVGFRGAERCCALGFKVEFKHIKNTKAVTIKRNGILREIENKGVREDIPFIFGENKRFDDLLGLDEGEGRNNALFKLRSQVAHNEDWRKILAFVNEYIFAHPLEPSEYEAVSREMVVNAEKDNEYEVAGWLLNEFDFLRYGGKYYWKKDESYSDDEMLLKRKIYKIVGKQKTRYVDEVYKQMEYRCREIPGDTVFDIKFKNGYLRDGNFNYLITQDFTPYTIDIEYKENATPVKIVDDYIDHLTNHDKDYRNLLMEVLGHTLIVDAEFKRLLAKFFIFEGKGGNGKGTLLQIIKAILGGQNVSGMSIGELTDERYLASFKGKLANLGDDLQDQAIDDKAMKILKNISTCDYISTRELYKNAENMFFTGSLIFTSNHSIKSWEKGDSYKRRVLWLPMFTKVKEKDKDPLFITKLTSEESLEYWIRLIVEGYKRLYENNKFTESDIVNRHNEKYHQENNPTLEFLGDYVREDIENKPVRDVYDEFDKWCEDNAMKASHKMLRETIGDIFQLESGVKKINNKSTRCFTEIETLNN